MTTLSKDLKLITLSLLLKTMPNEQKTLLMSHFNPEVAKKIQDIEEKRGDTGNSEIDWTPLYKSCPQLKKILRDCEEEARLGAVLEFARQQRPKIKEYILKKLGKSVSGPPVLLSQKVTQIIDRYMTGFQKK